MNFLTLLKPNNQMSPSSPSSSPPPPRPPPPLQNEASSTNAENNTEFKMNPYPLNGISSSALKEFLDKLTVDTQISNYVKLPMIAVMGDTSSGKSSLLSAISGIELPSASTLTTKCPIMLQLQKGEQVQATVKVQWRTQQQQQQQRVTPTKSPRSRKRELEQAPNGIRNNNSNNSNNNLDIRDPPPPTFEPLVITGSDDLETRLPQALQQAQDFILHYRNTLVAPDIISVRVTSPSITHDLTLVDLPGLVQFQLDEEQKQENNQNGNLLEQVQDLMHEYFDNPRCLLLAVVSAHVNIHNSRLLQLARTVDPTSSRTVVVLTKPDLVDPGSEQHVLELLQTSKHTYAPHGFHLVKNRGQAALDSGMTIAQGLKDEKTFFLETKPWNNGMADASQLGVPHVKSRLAQLQLQMIRESLPSILQEIQSQHASVQQALQELGPMYTSRVEQRRYYQSLLHDFMAHVHSQLSGKGRRPMAKPQHQPPPRPHQPLAAARLHQACTDFSHSIQAGSLATISTLVEGAQVLVTDVSCGIDIRGEIVHLDVKNQYACVDFVNPDDHTTDVLFDGLEYNTMDKHHEQQEAFQLDEVWTDGSQVYIARSEEMFDSLRKIPLRRLRTDPTWLVDKIAQYRTDDLACFLNVDIFQQIVAEFVQEDWSPHCYGLVDATEHILKSTLDECLQATATRFPALTSLLETTCHDVAHALLVSAREQLHSHLEMEQHHPYTQDDVLLDAIAKARNRTLKRDLELHLRLDQEGVVFDTQAISSILDRVFEKHSTSQLYLAEEMELVLSSYGQVSTKRVLDRTPMICWQACRTLSKKLQEALGCVTDDILQKCLVDSPETMEKYQDLTQQLQELSKAIQLVQSLR